MSRLSDIVDRVNLIIANNGRWSESNLISIADVGQKLIARRLDYLPKASMLPLYEGLSLYKLPTNVLKINRILYKGKLLPIVTREWLDSNIGPDWETHIGNEPKAIVLNLIELSGLRTYPTLYTRPENTNEEIPLEDSHPWGVIATGTDSTYGIVTGSEEGGEAIGELFIDPITGLIYENIPTDFNLDMSLARAYSSLEAQYTPAIEGFASDEDWGNATTPIGYYFKKRDDHLTVYASYSPRTLTDLSSGLEIPVRYDDALVHFIAGSALRQNEDTQSRMFAQEEIQLFNDELMQLSRDVATMGTTNKEAFSTNYVGAFNG